MQSSARWVDDGDSKGIAGFLSSTQRQQPHGHAHKVRLRERRPRRETPTSVYMMKAQLLVNGQNAELLLHSLIFLFFFLATHSALQFHLLLRRSSGFSFSSSLRYFPLNVALWPRQGLKPSSPKGGGRLTSAGPLQTWLVQNKYIFKKGIAPMGLNSMRTATTLGTKIHPWKISRFLFFLQAFIIWSFRSWSSDATVPPEAGQRGAFWP